MSDPVTNVEIEDVLSSIRRLVSNEEKHPPTRHDPVQQGGDDAQNADESPVDGDRLVLTPSLRVDNSKVPEPDIQDPDEPDEERDLANDRSTGSDEADAADEGQASDVRDAEEETPSDDADTPEAARTETGPTEETQATPEPEGESEAALKARVAAMEAVVASRDEQWEPDGTTDDAYSGSAGEPLPWEDFDPDEAEAKGTSDTEEKPDFGHADSGEMWDSADVPEHEPMADPAPMGDADDLGLKEEGNADLSEETPPEDILDEDALRDLVADIVREELQGALGERITRNVRKLVRREVHRALAIQDLE
ncbi:hypothetical protein [Roseovarius sp. E0-M6]|uniref:hypothetical protein n=1 Tax=Roseovarius sp. E0-M6 TaxID=3127118 RepID=UPI00301008E5